MKAKIKPRIDLENRTSRKSVKLLQNTHRFSMKWVRFFYLYGHGQGKKTLWGQLEEAALG